MTRRVALALALALTTAVTFAVVAFGAQIGYFGFNDSNGASQAEVLPPTPTPTLEPTIITEYIYLDQTIPDQSSGFITSRDGRRGDDDDDDDDDEYEWEWEHEDEQGHWHEHEHEHDD